MSHKLRASLTPSWSIGSQLSLLSLLGDLAGWLEGAVDRSYQKPTAFNSYLFFFFSNDECVSLLGNSCFSSKIDKEQN